MSTEIRKLCPVLRNFRAHGGEHDDTHCRKAYVSVNLDVDEEGVCHPRFIRWENGLIFQIDQILYKCRAEKVGGGGIRYTVMIRGRESFSFRKEQNGL